MLCCVKITIKEERFKEKMTKGEEVVSTGQVCHLLVGELWKLSCKFKERNMSIENDLNTKKTDIFI